jgi:YidC/Oxa1 family membrane protein insertase
MIRFPAPVLPSAIKFQQLTNPDSKFMDIKRIVLFAGLAVVSYLMILAWNEDYHQSVPVAQTSKPVNLPLLATTTL